MNAKISVKISLKNRMVGPSDRYAWCTVAN